MHAIRPRRRLAALLLAFALPLLPAAGATAAPKKKPSPAKPRVKVPMKFDESTAPTRPRAKIGADEKAAFRDAFIAGLAGSAAADAGLVEALASDLSDYYATRQITAEEVGRIRDALVAHLALTQASPGDLDGLVGRVNAVTEGSNLDMAEMENVSAAVRAVAESVRIATPADRKTEEKPEGRKRRGLFRRIFGR